MTVTTIGLPQLSASLFHTDRFFSRYFIQTLLVHTQVPHILYFLYSKQLCLV